MKKILFLAIAALVSLGAQAIDKVVPSVTASSENPLSAGSIGASIIENNEFFTITIDGKVITFSTQNASFVEGEPAYKFKLEKPTAISGEDYTGKYLIRTYTASDSKLYSFWGRNDIYLNMQNGSGTIIFGLGLNSQNGTDLKNGAVWSFVNVTGGVALKNVGRDKYLSTSGPSADPALVTVTTDNLKAYDKTAVTSAVTAVNGKAMLPAIQTALTSAKEAYEAEASLDNLDALVIAVNNAIESNSKFGIAVNDDITSLLSNPHFNTSDVSAWNMNGKASPGVNTTHHDCEFYEKDFNMSMTLTGMKKGTYEIGMQAFQRPAGANAAAAKAYDDNDWTSIATLYTTAMEVPVPNIMKDKQTTGVFESDGNYPHDSKFDYDGTTYYVPNSMEGASKWFEADYYKTTAKAVVTEDGGNLTFGFKGSKVSGGWVLFDNFTLKYISNEVLVDASESEKLIAKAPTGKMGASAKSALDAAVTALKADKTNATLYNELKDAISTAESSVAYYAVVTPYVTIYNNLDETSKTKVGWPASAIIGSDYTNGNLDEKGFADPKAMIKNHVLGELKKGVLAQTAPNSDMSLLINNANFEDGLTNWTNTNMKTASSALLNTDGGITFAEQWQPNGACNVEQTVKGLPAGTYKLTVYALSRATKEACIYINDAKTPITIADEKNDYTATVSINTGDELKVGSSCTGDGTANSWYAVDYFRLNLVNLGVNRATATGKCGTICLPYAFSATGATIYSASLNATKDAVVLEEVATPVAGTPYIYKATDDAQAFTYASGSVVDAPVAAAPLVGVFAATEVPVGSYVMQTKSGTQQFYQVATDAQPTLSANKAYLTIPTGGAKVLNIGTAEETAIKAIDALTSGDAKIYDMNGRKLNSLQKGINIVNGVKVLVK